MPAADITLDELEAALREAGVVFGAGDKGHTFRELCEAWKCGERIGRRLLRQAESAGMLRIGRRPITDMAGRPGAVPVYWFVRKEPA